ncbi:MAG: GrpE protein [Bryobacterales bacterium]|nr:GrpE protein [Bryobacterales bacterium]
METNPDRNDDRAEVDSPAALEAITAERDRLAAENAELQDRCVRAMAEFQNFRKRSEKDRLEFSEYASIEAVRTLLPIVDDFERALQTETADKTYAHGLELIRQRLFDALKKLGLEPIVVQGEPFDPHIHHAVEMVETEEVPDHTVLGEFQRGYNFKGRLLRPAMVKVAVEPKRD